MSGLVTGCAGVAAVLEALHLALPPSGRLMRILSPIVPPPATLMQMLDAEIAGRRGV
jgi:hypothetical protein